MRITANQVTFARLVAMPFLAALLYGGTTSRVIAVILGTIVGTTDMLDGYLARKHGPTVLGGLMDPIADKVFIAIAVLPAIDLHWVTWWPLALIFLREFIVTAARSSLELRARPLKTSYLAKVKTFVQMCGIGVVFLLVAGIPDGVLLGLLVGGTLAPIVAGLIVTLVLKKRWRGWWIFALGGGVLLVAYLVAGSRAVFHTSLVAMVAITWASGLDYLSGMRQLAGELKAFDLVRLAGAIALPLTACYALVSSDVLGWPIIAIVALELAVGGLDNLVAHHQAASSARLWGARVLGTTALLGLAIVLPSAATPLALAACAITVAGAAHLFVRDRRFYLEETLREKKQRQPAPTS